MKKIDPKKIITKLGGTVATANMCDVSSQAVSKWKRFGIPKARLKYLQLLKPDVFINGNEN